MRRLPPLLLLVARPLPVRAAEEGTSGLARVAWLLGAWIVLSVAATVVVAIWFRARARANERLSARIRREDWLEAAADGMSPRKPAE